MEIFKKNTTQPKIDIANIPNHIAIIMDGNGRWANKRGLPRSAGHKAGAQTLIDTVEACNELGVKYLTAYTFSTENWKRPQKEVDYLMDLLDEYLQKFREDERNKQVRIKVIGDINGLPKKIQNEIIKTEEITKNNIGIQLNLAINYGGRDEIHNAVKSIVSDVLNGEELDLDSINSQMFSRYLYTKDIPDPELIIRPSGELRLSNFLLYQCAYSEFWFSTICWPDFNKGYLLQAICDYQKRDRRFGGIINAEDKSN